MPLAGLKSASSLISDYFAPQLDFGIAPLYYWVAKHSWFVWRDSCALGKTDPVVCVFDTDNTCAIDLLKKYTTEGWTSPFCAVNFAVDEAECWLLADRQGIARFLHVKMSDIPDTNESNEVITPYKPSLYITKQIAPNSKSKRIRDSLFSPWPEGKPPTYNNIWPEFIERKWDIDRAMQNSNSLRRAVNRIKIAFKNYKLHRDGRE